MQPMPDNPVVTDSSPTATRTAQRIDSLDVVRGVAALGILLMNAVSFALPDAAYMNLEQAGNKTLLDTAIGVAGRILVDQKMMALFSLLFGVGIVIFAERAAAKGRRSIWLSLWRNLLLLIVGLAHTILWDGDVLTVYAVCAPLVLLLRKLPAAWLFGIGLAVANASAVLSLVVNSSIEDADLGEMWFSGGELSDGVGGLFLLDGFGRALGLMLIGVALFRLGFVQGNASQTVYRRIAVWGFGIGVPLSAAGLLMNTSTDWAGSSAFSGHAISTFGTVPMALGYLSLIVLWAGRNSGGLHARFQAVGRMAMTNYLTQTMIGVAVLTIALDNVEVSRTLILGFVFAVWALQLAWSPWWLARFRFGPFEWAWRCATYRSKQPLRR
jgi:uncharacterized protein|tara:strand:+ start:3167 stop:4315 length:1149 start_codon:yes stop_codon:yes gene_type:complete